MSFERSPFETPVYEAPDWRMAGASLLLTGLSSVAGLHAGAVEATPAPTLTHGAVTAEMTIAATNTPSKTPAEKKTDNPNLPPEVLDDAVTNTVRLPYQGSCSGSLLRSPGDGSVIGVEGAQHCFWDEERDVDRQGKPIYWARVGTPVMRGFDFMDTEDMGDMTAVWLPDTSDDKYDMAFAVVQAPDSKKPIDPQLVLKTGLTSLMPADYALKRGTKGYISGWPARQPGLDFVSSIHRQDLEVDIITRGSTIWPERFGYLPGVWVGMKVNQLGVGITGGLSGAKLTLPVRDKAGHTQLKTVGITHGAMDLSGKMKLGTPEEVKAWRTWAAKELGADVVETYDMLGHVAMLPTSSVPEKDRLADEMHHFKLYRIVKY